MFQTIFRRERSGNRAIVEALYAEIVAAARQPALYVEARTPDTPLGRFEMVALHVFLFLHRLQGEEEAGKSIAQDLTDRFFADMENSLRELGIGDLGVPKRMKKLGRMFYGRTLSYGRALEAENSAELAAALLRNVRPGEMHDNAAAALADYVFACRDRLKRQSLPAFREGALEFAIMQQGAAGQ